MLAGYIANKNWLLETNDVDAIYNLNSSAEFAAACVDRDRAVHQAQQSNDHFKCA